MDKNTPAFLLYPNDFTSDSKVEAMTTREVGAYFLLLCKAWFEKPVATIPNDDRVLARWARLTPDEWTECRDAVLAPFKSCPDNRLLSPRLSSEHRKLMESRNKRSRAGKIAAGKRWPSHAPAIPNAYQSHDFVNADAMPNDAISSSSSSKTISLSSRVDFQPFSPALLQAAELISLTPDAPLSTLILDFPDEDWIVAAIKEAVLQGKRSWPYVRGILRGYKINGGPPKDDNRRARGKHSPADRDKTGPADFSDVRTGEDL